MKCLKENLILLTDKKEMDNNKVMDLYSQRIMTWVTVTTIITWKKNLMTMIFIADFICFKI